MRVNSQKDSVEESTFSKEELEPSEQEARVQEADSATKTSKTVLAKLVHLEHHGAVWLLMKSDGSSMKKYWKRA